MSDQKDQPIFDEQTLARVLEAAYVLQEHNRALEVTLELQSNQLREQEAEIPPAAKPSPAAPQEKPSKTDAYTLVLAQIVETQHQIEVRQLPLQSSLTLVVERLAQMTKASGSAIGIVEGKTVHYEAVSGASALPQGSELPMEKALCFTCLHTAQAMRCPDVNPEFLLDADECHRRGIHALIAVPVFHNGGIIGALEIYFDKVNAFNEQDVHTCQLMTGLVTEAFARDAEIARKQSPGAEAAPPREARKGLKSNATENATTPAPKESGPKEIVTASIAAPADVCRRCGHRVVAEEQFCGKCGSSRIADDGSEQPTMQSKVASLLKMKQSKEITPQLSNAVAGLVEPPVKPKSSEHDFAEWKLEDPHLSEQGNGEPEAATPITSSAPDIFVPDDSADVVPAVARPLGEYVAENATASVVQTAKPEEIDALIVPVALESQTVDSPAPAAETAVLKNDKDLTWTSASKARDFLEQVAQSHNYSAFQRFWNMRRGDVYLAVAVILMAIVIRWGIWSEKPVSATGAGTANSAHRKQETDVPLFDRMLINLGLADPPDKPAPTGNPDTQVWVDLHTALYYCPGTDLYGKTPKGKFTTQKDAQLDQFEPAYRKVCN